MDSHKVSDGTGFLPDLAGVEDAGVCSGDSDGSGVGWCEVGAKGPSFFCS